MVAVLVLSLLGCVGAAAPGEYLYLPIKFAAGVHCPAVVAVLVLLSLLDCVGGAAPGLYHHCTMGLA